MFADIRCPLSRGVEMAMSKKKEESRNGREKKEQQMCIFVLDSRLYAPQCTISVRKECWSKAIHSICNIRLRLYNRMRFYFTVFDCVSQLK